jgi:hypothetical protein
LAPVRSYCVTTTTTTTTIIIIIIIIIIRDDPTYYCGMWQLAPTEYLKRHDGPAKIIHQKPAEAPELIEEKIPYYKYTPASVLENDSLKLYWHRSIYTDRTIPFNGPDIVCMNKKTKNTYLIDIDVPKYT